MKVRDETGQRTQRAGALLRPSVVAATLAAILLVPVGVSSATEVPSSISPDHLTDQNIQQVGDLFLASDPAPLGPFAAEAMSDDDAGAIAEAAPTIEEAFALHSRPSATRKILLDFDGQTVVSENWNGGEPIYSAAYSRGDQSDESFSATDLAEIQDIWSRVAEDFAVWDVDVTTEDPGTAGLARNGSGDVEYGVRVIISPTYEWYSTNKYGGVAYLDTFDRFEDLPAFVFSGNLSNGAAKSVAEGAAHEAGHTLGLSHDGITTTDADGNTTSSGYYSGHGDWAPIMGIGYYRPVTQWSKGDYPGATQAQDDLAIIDGHISRLPSSAASGSTLGLGDSSTPHALPTGGGVDEHTLQIEDGPVSVSVEKAGPEGNLLAELRIRNSSGQVVASADPMSSAAWSLGATLPAGTPPGTYSIEIESIGWTSPDDAGFTSYASMGGYVLNIDAPGSSGTTTPPPTTDPPTTEPPPPSESAGDRLTAVTPRRLIDTRDTVGQVAGPLGAGRDTMIAIDGLPVGATAVVLNVTAVAPRGAGYFSVSPCGVSDDARTSSLNFSAGRNIANSVIVPVSVSGPTAGRVCLYSSVAAHALLDLTGWIGAEGELSLEQLGSTRLVDTRDATGISGRLQAGVRTPISLASVLGSDTVGAVALNVTAIRPSTGGFLTIDDCSAGQQPTSSLNFVANEIRGNNGVFVLGAGQRLCVTSSAVTHVTIDVTGEFGTDAGLTFVANSSPERVLDTRATGRLDPGGITAFAVDTASGATALTRVPIAASVNLTATRHDDNGYVTAWSCGQRPGTSALNPSAGTATANGALVALSTSGQTCLFHATGGHLIVDLAGWWI